ncbi:MAG: sugar ABC transporter ATP-binding protein [Lachnospiraceae bacterium]|nr:sugar ABC transporter ATP-binding protein [Lachnospiraceae bacterium]
MENTAIKLKSITKVFPGVRALNQVSFEIKEGDVHCIIGENGAGKSTMIKILAGVQGCDEGQVELFGAPVHFKSPEDAKKAGIGVVYQELSNFMHLDVASNLFAGAVPTKRGRIDYKALYQSAREILDACGLDYINERADMNTLSLGSQQMVEIAALMHENARVVILDEPTSALTQVEVEKLFELIHDMKKKGVTIIYISHRLDEVVELADALTVLKDGEHVATMPMTKEITKDDMIRYMVGRDVAYEYGVGTSEIGEVLMEVEHLSSGKAVSDISFELHKGEILGIAGLEGSGRTELLETLFGWRETTGGSVKLHGKEVSIRNPYDAKKNRLAYITKERKILGLFLNLDIRQNIAAASTERYVQGGTVRYGKIAENAKKYIAAMSIKCSGLAQKVLNLSGGNQQKVLLSMWLSADPDVVLIDEPTRGVDVGAKAEIHLLLRDVVSKGKAVIMVSSEMPELMASCDRVMVMYEGRCTGMLDNKELREERLMTMASGYTESPQ